MTAAELGNILNEMYNKAPEGDKVANIHLFGVKYASVIIGNHMKVSDIVSASGINPTYTTEVSKGVKLSKYVVPKS